nr:reverse transcriptase domain-containing protein [Tanacetum cinerariifolium]
MEGHHPGLRKDSPKVKIAEGDVRSQNKKGKSQVLRRMICPSHGQLPPAEEVHQRSGQNSPHQAKRWGIHERVCVGYKLECRDVKIAPECMKILRFMHEITNPELIKRLHDKIPKLVDEMMMVTTTFLRGKIKQRQQEEGSLRKGQAAGNPDVISFLPFEEEDGTEGPMIIEAEMGDISSTTCMWTEAPLQKSCMNTSLIYSTRRAEHMLNNREGCLFVRQKKKGQAPERNKTIHEEVEKPVNAGIMKEVHYHSWLLNPMMVKTHDNSWRMCVDFKDLNKACLKDGYPLSEID